MTPPPATPASIVSAALDQAMMERALGQARCAARMGEVPVGAVVYRGDELLSEAHNLRESGGDPTAHAEVLAIRGAAAKLGSWRLVGCSVAVTLEPCPMCAGALVNARVSRLVFGAADPKMGAVSTLYELCTDARLNHRLEVVSGVLAEPCGRLLSEFFLKRRSGVGSG
jgi:tRNA(adenine34) deaminase